MSRKSTILCKRLRGNGFTLVELLVVIGIIGIIATLTMPALNAVLKGSQLSQAAQMVNDQISLARQTALAKNHSIEVRFYQFGDPEIPGEKATDATTGRFRALQSFEILESGSAVALGKMQRTPPSIIMDSGTLSSLLNTAPGSSVIKIWTPPADSQVGLPRGVGTNYVCCAFRFLPSGSTNLAPVSTIPWFLTLHNANDGNGLITPPKNFFTIQIDATNGHIKTYRP